MKNNLFYYESVTGCFTGPAVSSSAMTAIWLASN